MAICSTPTSRPIWCIIRGAARQLALVRAHGGQDIATSIIAAAELRYGVAKRGSTRLARQVETVIGGA
jgi:predicted nucleic acid-binding protein